MRRGKRLGRYAVILALMVWVTMYGAAAGAQVSGTGSPAEGEKSPQGAKPRSEKLKTSVKAVKTDRPAPPNLKVALQLLASPARDDVWKGLRQLKQIGKPTIVRRIADRLRKGLPPPLTLLAIEALVAAGRGPSGPVLIELVSHRREGIRKAAVTALGALRIRKAMPVLREALDDSDPGVRAAAAEALGRLRLSRSRRDLYHAFERGVPEAALAIATLARLEDVDKLVGYLGDHQFGTLKPAFDRLLNRTDFPRKGKLQLIARLGEAATPAAENYLQELVEELSGPGRKQMMRAISSALEAVNQARLEAKKGEADSTAPASAKAQPPQGKQAAPKSQGGRSSEAKSRAGVARADKGEQAAAKGGKGAKPKPRAGKKKADKGEQAAAKGGKGAKAKPGAGKAKAETGKQAAAVAKRGKGAKAKPGAGKAKADKGAPPKPAAGKARADKGAPPKPAAGKAKANKGGQAVTAKGGKGVRPEPGAGKAKADKGKQAAAAAKEGD